MRASTHAHINSYTPGPLVLCKRTHFIGDGGARRSRRVVGKKKKKYRGWTRCDPKVCVCVCIYFYFYLYIYTFFFFAARSHLFAFTFIRIVARDEPGTLVFIYYCFFFFFPLSILPGHCIRFTRRRSRIHTQRVLVIYYNSVYSFIIIYNIYICTYFDIIMPRILAVWSALR